MNTTTVPNAKNSTLYKSAWTKKPKENPHDTQNSVLVVAIYHIATWNQNGEDTDKSTHYMRWKNDLELENEDNQYNRFLIEFKRITELIRCKVNGPYAYNRMKTINVFLNNNKGGTLKGMGTNPRICTLSISPNYDVFTPFVKEKERYDDDDLELIFSEMALWKRQIEQRTK